VIDFFRDVTGTNIFVNWKAVEAAGVNRNTPVSARLRNIRFAKALTVLLDSATGGADKPKLGYLVDDGVITISTAEDLVVGDGLTRVYDVRDLVIPVPDFDPESDGKEREKANDPNNPARQEAVDALIKLLRDTVSPEQWGKSASVRELQGQLIITASREMHRTMIRLIQQLRESRAVQVSVEAKFVAVDDDVLAALPAGLREAVAGELRAGADPVRANKAAAGWAAPGPKAMKDPAKAVVLDAAQVDQVLRAVQESPKSSIVSAPRITLFNGQRAWVLTGNQRAYVADYAIVRQANGETKYEPKIETAQSGVMFRAQATASADRKFATLTLNPKLSYLGGMEDVPWDKSPAGENMTVQRPKLLVSQLATTASVPEGKTLLLGGLRGYEAAGGDGKGNGQLTNVLMLVKPTVIVQREVEVKQVPMVAPK
jgi:type II secretory pathway component GspD/PulD (secretin)